MLIQSLVSLPPFLTDFSDMENVDVTKEMAENSDVRSEIHMGLLRIRAAAAEDNKPPETGVQIQKKAAPSKLTKLLLPTFSVEPRNWQRFSNVFERNIHDNEDIEKFDDLTGSLQGFQI